MKKIFLAILTVATLSSCVNSYNIEGTSNVPTLDGRMLFLKVVKNNELKNIDSCEVVHGQFRFNGTIDSVRMGSIFMDDENVMPIVVESGNISIKIDMTQQSVSGTPLNDELFKFIDKFNQLENEMAELSHKESQAIMDGRDMEEVGAQLAQEAAKIAEQEDRLLTTFITDNFDNVLGPGIFMMFTAQYRYPELRPWIEDIMSKATDRFKNDAYVKDYYQKAQENQAILNGLATPAVQTPPMTDASGQNPPMIQQGVQLPTAPK